MSGRPVEIETFAAEAVAAQAWNAGRRLGANGIRDSVEHLINRLLGVAFDSDDLARSIYWVIANGGQLNASARKSAVEKFSFPIVAAKHLALYAEILASSGNRGARP
jgi:hypothetical protein